VNVKILKVSPPIVRYAGVKRVVAFGEGAIPSRSYLRCARPGRLRVGRFMASAKSACIQLLPFQADGAALLKRVA